MTWGDVIKRLDWLPSTLGGRQNTGNGGQNTGTQLVCLRLPEPVNDRAKSAE